MAHDGQLAAGTNSVIWYDNASDMSGGLPPDMPFACQKELRELNPRLDL